MQQRVPYPDIDNLDDEQKAVANEIASGPRGQIRGPMLLWLHSHELAARGQKVGEFLRWGTVFDGRLSELAILVTARHCDCHYVWRNHFDLAVKNGLATDIVEDIKHRRSPSFHSLEERTVYNFTNQLLRTQKVLDDTVATARQLFGDRGIVELTALIGYYQMGMYTLNVARVPLVDGSWTCLPE
jgi:4-carboxymuconolactone decarboxylase